MTRTCFIAFIIFILQNRFWTKNRATGYFIGNLCRGVALNRNFDFLWGTASSEDPCDNTFHGSGPFSEPETQNIRDVLLAHSDRLALFIDIQSFGSRILYGFGTGQLPPNALVLNLSAVNQAQAIDRVKQPHTHNYIVGNFASLTLWGSPASGGSSDYAQILGVPFSYTYKLPAFGGVQINTVVGFLVDDAFIEQAGMETWEGIKTGARFARDLFSLKATDSN